MASLYLPGQGVVDIGVARVHQAVKEYDERLSFKLNEETGDYCAFIATPRPHGPHNPPEVPVLGFGREVPTVEQALKRLYEADTARHGTAILQRIDRVNSEIQKEAKRKYDNALGNTVDHVEFAMRKDGKSPIIKSLPAKVKK